MLISENFFYDVFNLDIKTKKQILEDGKQKCFKWWVDTLGIYKGWSRKKIDINWDDIIKKINKDSHFTIIHRIRFRSNHLELGFITMDKGPKYFLWILCKTKYISYFEKKYKLKLK